MAEDFDPNWLQRLIVCCMSIGISKSELFAHYYFEEIPLIFEAYNTLHDHDDNAPAEVSAEGFFG